MTTEFVVISGVGNLHFVKFETSKIEQCLEFIQSKNLHHSPGSGQGAKPHMRVQATGGGAFKYADMFQVLPLNPTCAAMPPNFHTLDSNCIVQLWDLFVQVLAMTLVPPVANFVHW